MSSFETYIVNLMCSQKARCGSVEARRAGNPEEGGSSPVGGKVCLLVELWDWAIGKLQHHSFIFLMYKIKFKKKYMVKNQILAWFHPSFYGHFTIISMRHGPQKKNFFWPEKNFFLTPIFIFYFFKLFFQKVIETMVTLCPDLGHGQNP